MSPVLRISLPTPFPVGPVNVYLIRRDPITLVDTGVHSDLSREALRAGLAGAGLCLRDIRRIVVTHAHMDHCGLAAWIREESGGTCLAHPLSASSVREFPFDKGWMRANTIDFLARNGVPRDLAEAIAEAQASAGILQAPSAEVDEEIQGGASLAFDGMRLEVIEAPGHHPGHILLHDREAGRLFAGDQLLEESRTVPFLALMRWHDGERPRGLPDYLRSIEAIAALAPREVLPGHGGFGCDPGRRIRDIVRYHERRGRRVLSQLAGGAATAFELCRRMFRGQAEAHTFILMSEIVGQLDVLEEAGEVERLEDDGSTLYRQTRSHVPAAHAPIARHRSPPDLPESGVRLRRDGVWTHEGVEITHEGTVRLFWRSLRRDPASGRYYLQAKKERAWIDVEDAPHLVTSVSGRAGSVWIRLADETEEPLDGATIRIAPDNAFTCLVKGGEFRARLNRAAHYQLAQWIVEDPGGSGYAIRGLDGALHPIREEAAPARN